MGFDAEEFCIDYNIEHWTYGKNVSRGWVNVACPMCDDTSNHGGFNKEGGYYHCWNCKHHPMQKVIMRLVGCSLPDAFNILRRYTVNSARWLLSDAEEVSKVGYVSLPEFTGEMGKRHRRYLESRNFDPDRLIREFDLKGTGHIGDYKFRILAPITLGGQLISYQGRDITGKAELRYKACAKKDELIHHKYSLYNIDNVQGSRGLIVEGIADAWRMGNNSVATFGSSFTIQQVRMIAERFTKIFILYDSEEEAYNQAKELARMSSGLGVKAEVLTLDSGDPAGLTDDEAEEIKKELRI